MIRLAASSKTWVNVANLADVLAVLGRGLEEDVEVAGLHVLEALLVADLALQVTLVGHEDDDRPFVRLLSSLVQP